MKKIKGFKLRSTTQKNEGTRPLIEKSNNNNNEDIQDGYDQPANGHDNLLNQNILNTQKEQHLQSNEAITPLAELLGISPDSISVRPYSSEDGSICTTQPENLEQIVLPFIQTSVYKHLPKPPAELDQNLQIHLIHVQETVLTELQKLAPLFDPNGLMGCLIVCYHNQIFKQLNDELLQISSSKSCFVLLHWLLQTYLSQDLLGHPDFKEMDLTRKIDLLLLTDCVSKTQDKLLELVQKEVSHNLEKILQFDRQQGGCKCDEDLDGLYIYTIQCISAMPSQAVKISSKLLVQVQEVCLKELLIFVRSYTSHQTEILKEAKMTKPETINFLKTLKTCKKLKLHIQNNHHGVKFSLLKETVELLEDMQNFTLKRLLEIVTDITEIHLKKYFGSNNKRFFLMDALKQLFPKMSTCLDEQKSVSDDVYKLIAHLYLKHLIANNQKKLMKSWSQDIGQTVTEDAEIIHNTFSDLAPGVQQWNFTLLEISEVLECSTELLKLTVCKMKKECISRSCTDDLELLPALLRWKGLSKWEVREVLEALEVLPDVNPRTEPRTKPASWYCCFTCW